MLTPITIIRFTPLGVAVDDIVNRYINRSNTLVERKIDRYIWVCVYIQIWESVLNQTKEYIDNAY